MIINLRNKFLKIAASDLIAEKGGESLDGI